MRTKQLWSTAIAFIFGQIPNLIYLSDPPAIVSFIINLNSSHPTLVKLISPAILGFLSIHLLYGYWRLRVCQIRTEGSLRDFSQKTSELIRNVRHTKLNTISQECCDAAVKVFESRLPRKGIGCAIRLRKERGFVTIARSGRLSQARKNSSTPVSLDGTLAQLLDSDDAKHSSVIICPDVDMAHKTQQLELDANSTRQEFKDEVKSMMLARIISINSSDEAEVAGIFYITSDKVNGLSEEQTDLMVTVSSMVSEVIREKLDTPSMDREQFKQLITALGNNTSSQSYWIRSVRGEKSGKKQRNKNANR